MKLIVMIPAYDEEKTIGKVIEEIPREIEGFDKVEVQMENGNSIPNIYLNTWERYYQYGNTLQSKSVVGK